MKPAVRRARSFTGHRRKPGPLARPAPSPVIDIQISMPRERRRALRAALAKAVADGTGPWRIRVSTQIIYLTPNAGSFWVKLTLITPTGATIVALLDPDKPATAENIEKAIATAVRRGQTTSAR
jgi:hypothetical protein